MAGFCHGHARAELLNCGMALGYGCTVESERRGRGHKPNKSLTPGTFRPARPADSQGVVQLFAIAARAACAQPTNLSTISYALDQACAQLLRPELDAAQECGRMWQLFAKVAQLPKDSLRLEAGRAFCRDLDALAQRLELPPLAEWVDLPEAISDANHAAAPEGPGDGRAPTTALPLGDLQARARELLLAAPGKQVVPPNDAAQLMARFEATARAQWLDTMVGQGVLGRTDVSLLIRFLAKGGAVAAGDSMLIEVLGRLVRALARTP